jgi:predicted secreted hydrolase
MSSSSPAPSSPAPTAAEPASVGDAAQDVAHLLHQRTFDPTTIDPGVLTTLTSRRNSPAETAQRLRRYLQHLLEHPVSRVPDRSELWRSMLEHCDELSPLQAYTMRQLMGSASNAGYPAMPDRVELQFPRDHRVQLHDQTGWHFLVGSLWDEDGNEFGLEMMLFGIAMYPEPFAKELGLSPLDNLAVEVQFAISERGVRHHQGEPLVALGTSGLVRTNDAPFEFSVGANSMSSGSKDDLFPLRVQSWGLDRGGDEPLELACDITLASGKGVLAQGEDGAMPSVGGIGTYYYSIPNITIDPSCSTIRLGAREIRVVRGQLWFDHQWGFLSGVSEHEVLRASQAIDAPNPAGWDWFMAQLTGDRQVTMFAQHRNEDREHYFDDGADAPATMTRRVGGTYMDETGATSLVWGTMVIDDWVKVEHTPDPDRYPATHTWHPNHYRFAFDDLPDDISTFTMTPIVEGGQSAFFSHGVQICEGAVVVADAEGNDIGRGFAEAVNYADTLANSLRLAGLPVTDEMLALAADPVPDAALAAANTAYVAAHQDEFMSIIDSSSGLSWTIEGFGAT